MKSLELMNKLRFLESSDNQLKQVVLTDSLDINIYPKSVTEYKDNLFFIAKQGIEKFLFIIGSDKDWINVSFDCEKLSHEISRCALTTRNREGLQKIFAFTIPVVIGLKNSFGFGDRIGLANPGHIRSLKTSDFKPILAQQSIRELNRTNRTPDEVMDAAVYAAFQEGYKEGFGADADHLKTDKDIDLMINAGYKMFTFDPSDYVDNEADNYDEDQLLALLSKLPWGDLEDSFPDAELRYLSNEIEINDQFKIRPNDIELLRAYAKYGKAIAHIKSMYDYMQENYDEYDYEIEVSVDETESVTSPFEHFFFANELNRLKVKFISLAPRFIGAFEKGIDYKGDLKLFEEEYKKHLAITKYFASYKISLHSGSDKFSVYKVIGSMKDTYTHVKTAGTSYLEALKVTAIKEPVLFREILDYSGDLYEKEKRTYHVSADINKLKPADEYKNSELADLFNSNDVRQILHVTFGRILTDTDKKGNYIFKERIMDCLKKNEETHYELIIKHFHNHLEPFNSK